MNMKMYATTLAVLTLFVFASESFAQRRPPRSGGGSRSSSSSSSRSSSSRPNRSSSSSSSSSSSRPSRPSRPTRPSPGPSYNPPRRSSSSSSSSSSTSRPTRPTRPSTGSTTRPTRPSGPVTSNRTRRQPPTISGGSSRPANPGARYNPPGGSRPTAGSRPSRRPVRVGPHAGSNRPGTSINSRVVSRRPAPTHPRVSRTYNRPYVRRRVVTHRPHVFRRTLVRRYPAPSNYHRVIRRRYIYRHWVHHPVAYWYADGFYYFNDYPYYVYNGYQYRYSNVDICNYELVDSFTNEVVKDYHGMECSRGFDACALDRDAYNSQVGEYQYFCAERVEDDLANNDATTFDRNPNDVTADRQTQLQSFVDQHTPKQLFKKAYKEGVGKCKIIKKKRSERKNKKCKYFIKVGEYTYPKVDESVCSQKAISRIYGCAYNSQKKNASCLLSLAILDGYCI